MNQLLETLEKYPPIVCLTVRGFISHTAEERLREIMQRYIKGYQNYIVVLEGEYTKLEIITVLGTIQLGDSIQEKIKEAIDGTDKGR